MFHPSHPAARAAAIFACLLGILADPLPAFAQAVKFDVNDVSFLFPVPTSKTEADARISLADEISDGPILPENIFQALMKKALEQPGIRLPAGLEDQFKDLKTWKVAGIRVNPSALLGHVFDEGAARKVAALFPNDVLTGVPLTETDHHGAPFALTEEFAAVYRLHPLIPDEIPIANYKTGEPLHSYTMKQVSFTNARAPFAAGALMDDAMYSFGIANPGAITIGNYPDFLRKLELPKDATTGVIQTLDLAAVDILRDRERGVPRYNEFRRQLHKEPVKTWEELAGVKPELAPILREVYQGELELVDTMVGMFCEIPPKGFGFSDTAFRVFILMASRRLKSDRFFTSDFREEIYTRAGLDHIRATGMKEVILRHHEALKFAFDGVANPFAPWRKAPSKP